MTGQSTTIRVTDLSGVTTVAEARAIVHEHLDPLPGDRYAPVYVWRKNGTTRIQPESLRYNGTVESILRHAPHWDLEVTAAETSK